MPAIYGNLIKCRGCGKAHAQGRNAGAEELWAKVANESLERTGDEGRAIREANAVVARQAEHSY